MTARPHCSECQDPADITLGNTYLCSGCAVELLKQQRKRTEEKLAEWREGVRARMPTEGT